MDENRSPLIRTDFCKYTRGEGKIPNKRIRPLFPPLNTLSRLFSIFVMFHFELLSQSVKAQIRNGDIANRVSERRLSMSLRGMICSFHLFQSSFFSSFYSIILFFSFPFLLPRTGEAAPSTSLLVSARIIVARRSVFPIQSTANDWYDREDSPLFLLFFFRLRKSTICDYFSFL